MPKIKFENIEIGSIQGLPNVGEKAANFNVMKLNGHFITQLKKHQGQTIVLNLLPNYSSQDGEANDIYENMLIYSMKILNEVFSGYKSISLFHIMAAGEQAKKYTFMGIDNFWTILNPKEFGKDYGLQIKTNSANQNEILLARAIVIINPQGKIVYHELVPDLMDAPNFKTCYDAAAQGILPRPRYKIFWRDQIYRKLLKKEEPKQDAQAPQLESSKENDKSNAPTPKHLTQHSGIRSLVYDLAYDEIMAREREYSEMLEKYNNPFGDENGNSERKASAEKSAGFSSRLKELSRLFSILGKTQDKIGKIEERFQKLADTLADWLNGAPLISEIMTNSEECKQFSNGLITLLAKNLTSFTLSAPTISMEEIYKIISSTIQECLDGYMKADKEKESEGLKYLSEILNDSVQRQSVFDELFYTFKMILTKDSFILEICQNPGILCLSAETEINDEQLQEQGHGQGQEQREQDREHEIKQEKEQQHEEEQEQHSNPASEPASTKSTYSVASEIANSLTELVFTARGTLRPKDKEEESTLLDQQSQIAECSSGEREDEASEEDNIDPELQVKCAL